MTATTHPGRPFLGLALCALTLVMAGCAQQPPQQERSSGPPPLLPGAVESASVPVPLRNDAPQTYTVQPGDTLWSIAGRYLDDPWRWRELWQQNPELRNPNLIYPGDVLEVYYAPDGQPRLRRTAAGSSGDRATVKLLPQVRIEALTQPIPTVPRDTIESFLNNSLVLLENEWAGAPYVVGGNEERLSFGPGDRIYARGEFDNSFYRAFRPGEPYLDPKTDEQLGFEVTYLADALLENSEDDPALLRLTEVKQGVQPGDRLFPSDEQEDLVYQFLPHPVDEDTRGQIIASLGGGFLVGRYQTVVINLGDADGLEAGHVLATYSGGRVTDDPLTGQPVTLPPAQSGLVMVYRVFDRVSYALVMEASQAIRILDEVGAP